MKNKFPLWQYAVFAFLIMAVIAMFICGVWLIYEGFYTLPGWVLFSIAAFIILTVFLYYKIDKPNEPQN